MSAVHLAGAIALSFAAISCFWNLAKIAHGRDAIGAYPVIWTIAVISTFGAIYFIARLCGAHA